MLWVLIFIAVAGAEPIALKADFATEADCAAALATVRTVESEVRAPYQHFCLSADAWTQYQVLRREQRFQQWLALPPEEQ